MAHFSNRSNFIIYSVNESLKPTCFEMYIYWRMSPESHFLWKWRNTILLLILVHCLLNRSLGKAKWCYDLVTTFSFSIRRRFFICTKSFARRRTKTEPQHAFLVLTFWDPEQYELSLMKRCRNQRRENNTPCSTKPFYG